MTYTQAERREWLEDAYAEGRQAAEDAASWIVDGNTTPEAVRYVLELFEEGDPAVWDYLPAYPDLSGQWADDPTPLSLARDITGLEFMDGTEVEGELMHAIADEWERGVSEHFETACEHRLLAIDSTPEDDDNQRTDE